jgi:8-oxo-dGTP pyrophosphatase MutT (NUDIX family)
MVRLLQAGAIPFRQVNGGWQYLLITSQRGNWIFPKGIVEPGETPEQTALKECLEEAGIRGSIVPTPLGSYADHKWRRDCQVLMYLLRYEKDEDLWQESGIRERHWFSYEEAALRVKKAELRRLLEAAREKLERGV